MCMHLEIQAHPVRVCIHVCLYVYACVVTSPGKEKEKEDNEDGRPGLSMARLLSVDFSGTLLAFFFFFLLLAVFPFFFFFFLERGDSLSREMYRRRERSRLIGTCRQTYTRPQTDTRAPFLQTRERKKEEERRAEEQAGGRKTRGSEGNEREKEKKKEREKERREQASRRYLHMRRSIRMRVQDA